MKQVILNHLKNIPGWRTKRKLVVFSVDDYGNVRLDSREARERMDKAGLKILNRFDAYDALETGEDLEMLFEVLRSVKGNNGRHAVFTPYAVPCNIDFESMAQEDYQTYRYERLPKTYEKLTAMGRKVYERTGELWGDGMKEGLLRPEFHGREHLNLKLFQNKLSRRDPEVLTALKNRSYTSISHTGYTHSFAFVDKEDIQAFPTIMSSGIQAFKKVFESVPAVFTPPGLKFPPQMEAGIHKYGLRAIDKPLMEQRYMGDGKYRWELNKLGYAEKQKAVALVRNVVFEPTDARGFDWVSHTLKQIGAAFRLGKPVNISSHRVNFCGYIDSGNRREGLAALKELLHQIVQRWPEVEFISASELVELIEADQREQVYQ